MLGSYEFDLARYRDAEVVPRVFRDHAWQAARELRFTHEVIDTAAMTRPQLQELIRTFDAWRDSYRARERELAGQPDERGIGVLASYAADGADVLLYELASRVGSNLYVITRLNGRIVSALIASWRDRIRTFDSDANTDSASTSRLSTAAPSHDADAPLFLEYAVSALESVLPLNTGLPERFHADAVRGAGEAGVRALARYARRSGIATIRAEVVSRPSAIVKRRVGFVLRKEEL